MGLPEGVKVGARRAAEEFAIARPGIAREGIMGVGRNLVEEDRVEQGPRRIDDVVVQIEPEMREVARARSAADLGIEARKRILAQLVDDVVVDRRLEVRGIAGAAAGGAE